MKVGFRKPNIKKSIKARTTSKVKRKMKKAVNPFYGKKGMGYIKNPKKAVYNKVYNKTTFGLSDISNKTVLINKEHTTMNKNALTIILLIVFFPVGLYLMWAKTNWNKTVKIVITVLIAILALVGLFSPSDGNNADDNTSPQVTATTTDIREFEFMYLTDNTIELEIKNSGVESKKNSYFKVYPNKEVNIDDIEFISENPEIATFTYDKTALTSYIYFDVTAVGVGETYIYVQTKDKSVVSDKIKVIVTEEETTTATETTTEETTTKIIQEATTEEQPTEQKSGITVYITPTGEKYHYSKSCAGKNAKERDLEDVRGSYEPCKKCAQ